VTALRPQDHGSPADIAKPLADEATGQERLVTPRGFLMLFHRCCPWRAGKLAKAIHALQITGA
jgi:hypothetical protein